ncbi:unnamed protein product [marine sediment metagenome]|uniref:Uncharacterized protein n=1 Tax=marine sediment metagenome TaxID=412755 RepID=X1CV65_9ZZZZ
MIDSIFDLNGVFLWIIILAGVSYFILKPLGWLGNYKILSQNAKFGPTIVIV